MGLWSFLNALKMFDYVFDFLLTGEDISRPSIDGSKWNAVANPIVYRFTRKDFIFNQINDVGGAIEIQINGSNQTANFSSGDNLWIQSDNGIYSQPVTVFSSAFGGGNTTILCNESYISAAPGGYANNNTLRPLYKLSIGVYSGSTLLGTNAYSGNKKGEIIADVSRPLWSNMSPDLNIDLMISSASFKDSNAYKSFYIDYNETWVGSSNTAVSDFPNVLYAVYGARQIPALYGGNMYEYVFTANSEVLNYTDFTSGWTNEGSGESWIFGSSDAQVLLTINVSKRARTSLSVLSGLTLEISINTDSSDDVVLKVYFSNGQSIDFGVIVGTSNSTQSIVLTSDITYFEIEADDTITATGTTLIINDVTVSTSSLNKFLTKLDTYVMWRDWPCLVSIIVNEEQLSNVYLDLDGNGQSSDEYYNASLVIYDLKNIVLDQSVDYFQMTLKQFGTNNIISEEKQVILKDVCDNPIMLLARNTLGGCISWLFDVSQDYTFEYADGRKAKRLVLFADNLTLNEWESLQDFITLGEVYRNNIVELTSSTIKTKSRIGSQVYAVDQDGNTVGVTVIPTKNTTKTRQIKNRFEIEIEYPEEFNA